MPPHCIHTYWLQITVRRIGHTRPDPFYSYKFAQNYDPPYHTYNVGAIVFIQIGSKLRSAVSTIQGRRHCIYRNLLQISICRIVHTRPDPLYLYRLAPNYCLQYRPYKARRIVFIQIGSKLRSAVSSIQCRRHCNHTDWLFVATTLSSMQGRGLGCQ